MDTRSRLLHSVPTTVAGVLVVLAGIVMLVLPGPGLVTISVGLGLLGRVFPSAARLQRAAHRRLASGGRAIVALTRRQRTGSVPSQSTAAARMASMNGPVVAVSSMTSMTSSGCSGRSR